jgi:phosphoribosylcarboxyaminoimidazole (NCAIR) mutase
MGRITTMPNNQPPAKTRIDERVNKALADLKKVTDANPDLNPDLKSVKDSLEKIVMDNHKAQ